MRTGASAVCSSLGARNSSSEAVPSQISERRAIAAERAGELVHRGLVVHSGVETREVAHVDELRRVVRRSRIGDVLERDRALRQAAVVGGERAAERRARLQSGLGAVLEPEVARHPDRSELLGEALEPAAHEREVAIHPDVRAGRDLLAVEHGVDDEEELHVLTARRVEQLGAAVGAALPIGEDRRRATGIGRVRLEAGRQDGAHGLRVGPVLDHHEVADVMPGRARHQRRAAAGGERERVALEHRISLWHQALAARRSVGDRDRRSVE